MKDTTVTITPKQHESLRAHLKTALLLSGHVAQDVADAVAEVGFAAVISGAVSGQNPHDR